MSSKSDEIKRFGEAEILERRLVIVIDQILARDDMNAVSLSLVEGASAKDRTPPPAGRPLAGGRSGMITKVAYTQSLDEKIENCQGLASTISHLLTQITQA